MINWNCDCNKETMRTAAAATTTVDAAATEINNRAQANRDEIKVGKQIAEQKSYPYNHGGGDSRFLLLLIFCSSECSMKANWNRAHRGTKMINNLLYNPNVRGKAKHSTPIIAH